MAADPQYDVLVVGGGINGAGIARDAAGRGLSVLLCEQDDLAAHTSSASTKLIHGGLRYLEHYEFNLVRKALQEREVLLRAAPHIISPLRFVMPHHDALRPAWLIRAGLFLYDHLGKRELLAGSRGVDLRDSALGQPLQRHIKKGFVYSDAWVDDARLVVLTAMDAAERGATIMPRTRLVGAERHSDYWEATLETADGTSHQARARTLVNAAGPWVVSLLRDVLSLQPKHALLMAKGSHIVVPKLYEHDHAYILQNPDRRIIFAIPYEQHFTLVGTTDVAFNDDPACPKISDDETAYLCEVINGYFERRIHPRDVLWSYSGVRPLLEDDAADLSAVTRDYRLEYGAGSGRAAPLLSVFGGKITTYRRLAEEALDLLAPAFGGVRPVWTARANLPGGDIANADFEGFVNDLGRHYAWLPPPLLRRYARAYGTRVHRLLHWIGKMSDLGRDFGGGLYEAEVDYLTAQEWARTPEDILWRRSKLGLHAPTETAEALQAALPGFLTRLKQKQELRYATNA